VLLRTQVAQDVDQSVQLAAVVDHVLLLREVEDALHPKPSYSYRYGVQEVLLCLEGALQSVPASQTRTDHQPRRRAQDLEVEDQELLRLAEDLLDEMIKIRATEPLEDCVHFLAGRLDPEDRLQQVQAGHDPQKDHLFIVIVLAQYRVVPLLEVCRADLLVELVERLALFLPPLSEQLLPRGAPR
jgi:hypothetical protein